MTATAPASPAAPGPAPASTPATAGQALLHTGRRVAIAALVVVCAGAAIAGGYAFWRSVTPYESTDNAYVKGDLTFVSPKVAGYVLSVETENNRRVSPGQVIVRIDPGDYASAARDAEAAVQQRLAAFSELAAQEALQAAQIRVVGTNIISAQATLTKTEADMTRADTLVQQGAVSRQYYEQAREEMTRSSAALTQARAQSDFAQQQLAVLGAQRETLQAELESAQAKLVRARDDLARTEIRAPREGLIAARNVRPGEYVGVGTRLMAIAPTQGLWVEANLRETQLARIAAGDHVEVRVDALAGGALCGRVESVSGASGSEFSVLPADNATGNFTKIVRRFPVRILLDPGQPRLVRLGTGMSAEISIRVGSHDHGDGQAATCG